jgi:ComF family protein
MLKKIEKMQKWMAEIIFPAFCAGCGKEGNLLCPECFNRLPIRSNINCFYCQKRLAGETLSCPKCKRKAHSSLEAIFVASEWEDETIKKVIYGLKYLYIKDYSKVLAQIAIDFLQKTFLKERMASNYFFVPVPLHPKRLAWRGFNQAQEIAQIIGRELDIPVMHLLERSRYTLPQAEIKDKKSRRENIASAFRPGKEYLIIPEAIGNKNAILVDDVSTTGYTLNECAKSLKSFGLKKIYGLVIARG